MKKSIVFLLCIILLCGCAAPAENTAVSVDTSASASEPSTTRHFIGDTENDDIPIFTTPLPTGLPDIIPADLAQNQQDLFVTEANWDADIYTNSPKQYLHFLIYSHSPLEKENVSVEVPVETPYNIMFDAAFRGSAPIELNGNPGAAVLFTYDTYLHYCGFDWKEYASQYKKMLALNKSGSAAEYLKAQEACKAYYNAHLDDYLLLQESMLPQFYYYQVTIMFTASKIEKEEAFSQITLTVNGETTTRDIGEVRLHPQRYKQTENDPIDLLKEYRFSSYREIPYLSNQQGMLQIMTASFAEDVLITGFNIQTDGIAFGEFNLRVTSNGKSANFTWDGKMPIEVAAGGTVEIWATITDQRLAIPGFEIRCIPSLELEMDGVEYQYRVETSFYHFQNCFETYAEYFHGLDFTEYYEEYYFPYILGINTEE